MAEKEEPPKEVKEIYDSLDEAVAQLDVRGLDLGDVYSEAVREVLGEEGTKTPDYDLLKQQEYRTKLGKAMEERLAKRAIERRKEMGLPHEGYDLSNDTVVNDLLREYGLSIGQLEQQINHYQEDYKEDVHKQLVNELKKSISRHLHSLPRAKIDTKHAKKYLAHSLGDDVKKYLNEGVEQRREFLYDVVKGSKSLNAQIANLDQFKKVVDKEKQELYIKPTHR